MGAGLYRINFFALLLCMALGSMLNGNPFYAASVFLFADMVLSCMLGNIAKLVHRQKHRYLFDILSCLVIAGGLVLVFLYPVLSSSLDSVLISLFCFCMVLRDFFCSVPVNLSDCPLGSESRRAERLLSFCLIQLLFDLLCAWILLTRFKGTDLILLLVFLLISGALKLFLPSKRLVLDAPLPENKYSDIASYRIFSDMNLYSTISMNLGVMSVLFVVTRSYAGEPSISLFACMLVWLFLIWAVSGICYRLTSKRFKGLALSEFILGAITWCLGAVFMFKAHTLVFFVLWTFVWSLGITLISSSLRKFSIDFEAVGELAGEEYGSRELNFSNMMVSTSASLISSAIMLIMLCAYSFLNSDFSSLKWHPLNDVLLMQLPLVFMLAALFVAFRQPLDYRNREKLMRYIDAKAPLEPMKESLKSLFVKKYRMRFGVKILCTLARPFLRLRVSGRERIDRQDSPSVFVCNHGFLYGPVSAVIYLPTYFRPWIHNVMLDTETAVSQMHRSLSFLDRIFGRKASDRLIRGINSILQWVLNSFNPIPVVRGASRDVMSTFDASLQALLEGDNILIFPEKPRELNAPVEDDEYDPDRLRNFYTGFAHIGKMYYDATGKSLLFYPLFSDRDRRLFRIGEPVRYDATLPPRESKQKVARELQRKMNELSE